jgi:hypothetical protein
MRYGSVAGRIAVSTLFGQTAGVDLVPQCTQHMSDLDRAVRCGPEPAFGHSTAALPRYTDTLREHGARRS